MTTTSTEPQASGDAPADPTIQAAEAAGQKAYADCYPHSAMFNLTFMMWVKDTKRSLQHASQLCDAYTRGHKAAWQADVSSDGFIVLNNDPYNALHGGQSHA